MVALTCSEELAQPHSDRLVVAASSQRVAIDDADDYAKQRGGKGWH